MGETTKQEIAGRQSTTGPLSFDPQSKKSTISIFDFCCCFFGFTIITARNRRPPATWARHIRRRRAPPFHRAQLIHLSIAWIAFVRFQPPFNLIRASIGTQMPQDQSFPAALLRRQVGLDVALVCMHFSRAGRFRFRASLDLSTSSITLSGSFQMLRSAVVSRMHTQAPKVSRTRSLACACAWRSLSRVGFLEMGPPFALASSCPRDPRPWRPPINQATCASNTGAIPRSRAPVEGRGGGRMPSE